MAQSSKIGTSSSPIVNRVIQNSADNRHPVNVPGILKTAFNKSPIPAPAKKK